MRSIPAQEVRRPAQVRCLPRLSPGPPRRAPAAPLATCRHVNACLRSGPKRWASAEFGTPRSEGWTRKTSFRATMRFPGNNGYQETHPLRTRQSTWRRRDKKGTVVYASHACGSIGDPPRGRSYVGSGSAAAFLSGRRGVARPTYRWPLMMRRSGAC